MINLLLSFLFIFFIQVNPITGMVINIKELKDAMEVCVAVHCEYSSSSSMLPYHH